MSLPITTRWRCSPRRKAKPAAWPTFSAMSAVIWLLARPLMPSVPKCLRAISHSSPRGPLAAGSSERPNYSKQNQIKSLGFPWFYSSESGFFNGLRPIQIKNSVMSHALRKMSQTTPNVSNTFHLAFRSRRLAGVLSDPPGKVYHGFRFPKKNAWFSRNST